MSDIKCPFCLGDNFDLIGLKGHLENGWCDVYNVTWTPSQEAAARMEKERETFAPMPPTEHELAALNDHLENQRTSDDDLDGVLDRPGGEG